MIGKFMMNRIQLNFWMFCLGSWIHHASRRFALSPQTPSRKRSSSFRRGRSGGMSSSTSFDQFLEMRRSSLSSTLPSMALAHLLENWQNRTVAGCKNKHPDEIGWLVLDPSHASLNQFERAEVTSQEQLVAFWQDFPRSHTPQQRFRRLYILVCTSGSTSCFASSYLGASTVTSCRPLVANISERETNNRRIKRS